MGSEYNPFVMKIKINIKNKNYALIGNYNDKTENEVLIDEGSEIMITNISNKYIHRYRCI